MSARVHLVKRFAGSLWPGGPGAAAEDEARSLLLEGERHLWARMSGADRRHAVGVARRARSTLGEVASRPVLAAALLHDIGKIDAGLGTFARVVATLVGTATGRRDGPGRVGRYLRHDALGADLLVGAGSDPLTVAWAREHHLPEDRWTLDPAVARALKEADDD